MTVFEREAILPNQCESLVRCRPITGRLHQIRVHLKALGVCVHSFEGKELPALCIGCIRRLATTYCRESLCVCIVHCNT